MTLKFFNQLFLHLISESSREMVIDCLNSFAIKEALTTAFEVVIPRNRFIFKQPQEHLIRSLLLNQVNSTGIFLGISDSATPSRFPKKSK